MVCIATSIRHFRKYHSYNFVPSAPCNEAKSLTDLREKRDCKQSIYSVFHQPWLFNHWITLCTRYTSIHGITQLGSLILIRWIVIYQAPVVQKLDSAIHRINPYPTDISVSETNCAIQCIEVYPVDSIINLLNNWGLVDSVIQCLNNWSLVFKAFLYSIHLTDI